MNYGICISAPPSLRTEQLKFSYFQGRIFGKIQLHTQVSFHLHDPAVSRQVGANMDLIPRQIASESMSTLSTAERGQCSQTTSLNVDHTVELPPHG